MNTPCSVPRCPAFAAYRGRCIPHARQHEQGRGSPTRRGYTYAWEQVRRRYLARFPSCVACGALATQVDHILPLKAGGRHELWNLRGLCATCHSRRTIRENPPKGRTP